MIRYQVDFKSYVNGKYYSQDREFNDENHFQNWLKKYESSSPKSKIIGYKRIYDEDFKYTEQDMYNSFMAGRQQKEFSFLKWLKQYTKDNNIEE